jgi:predicted membrane channel-forming protein YqfA (hemolysin III family)
MIELFDICVDVLIWIAGVCGITYKEANIWIFVIIEPVLFLLMGALIIWQRDRINKLKQLRGSIEE